MLKFQASSIILTRQVEGLLWLSTLSLESHSSYIMDLGYPNQITYLPQHLSHHRTTALASPSESSDSSTGMALSSSSFTGEMDRGASSRPGGISRIGA